MTLLGTATEVPWLNKAIVKCMGEDGLYSLGEHSWKSKIVTNPIFTSPENHPELNQYVKTNSKDVLRS